jgi:hypothetical protein
MSALPIAGTYRLDGILQGPLPPAPGLAADLEAWVASARKAGLHFHLSVDGAAFSIVPDPAVRPTSGCGGRDVGGLVEEGLNAMLSLLPEGARAAVFSTVRSEEFRPGIAVQTIHALGPGGRIVGQRREVAMDTADARPELNPAVIRRIAKWLLLGLVAAALLSVLFVDYRKLFANARERLSPLTIEEVAVDCAALGNALEARLTAVDSSRGALRFRLQRGTGWDQALAATPQESLADWGEFATRLAIRQGRLRVELFDKDGNGLGSGELPLRGLLEKPETEVVLLAKPPGRLAKIVVRP